MAVFVRRQEKFSAALDPLNSDWIYGVRWSDSQKKVWWWTISKAIITSSIINGWISFKDEDCFGCISFSKVDVSLKKRTKKENQNTNFLVANKAMALDNKN